MYPVLKREYIDTGKVRFILREFPIGKQSGSATIAMRCAPADKRLELYDKFMKQQASWVSQEVRLDPIFKIASQVGMTREQFDACFANQAMVASLNANKERGRTLGVIGTPNFFIQGKLIKSTLDRICRRSAPSWIRSWRGRWRARRQLCCAARDVRDCGSGLIGI